MRGKEFIKRAKKWAKAHGRTSQLISNRAKGGHQLLIVGKCRTTVKSGEIGPGLLNAMLKQLNIPKREF